MNYYANHYLIIKILFILKLSKIIILALLIIYFAYFLKIIYNSYIYTENSLSIKINWFENELFL